MKSITSWISRLFKGNGSTIPAQPPAESRHMQRTLTVVEPAMEELDRDNERFRSRSSLSLMERHYLEEELRKKYAGDGLKLLLSKLTESEPAETKDIALQRLTEACQSVNQVYPLNWRVISDLVTDFDSTSRYMLIAHSVWLNPNGAYCIMDDRKKEPIFHKAAADTSAFAEPKGFAEANTPP